jgi:hypothetical protein
VTFVSRPHRTALSILLAWHVLAITIAAIPAPDTLETRASAPDLERESAFLNAAASLLQSSAAWLWRAAGPLRSGANLWVRMTGLTQQWNMFSVPPQSDEYLRLRYFVESRPADGAGVQRVATELVMPAVREDRVRLAAGFRGAYRDKLVSAAVTRFRAKRDRRLIAPDTRPQALPDDLAPIARYFARQFAERSLGPSERVVRVEVWHGTAPNPPPGERNDLETSEAYATRLSALQDYYAGPVETRTVVSRYSPYHALEREADIRWLLEYFEEPGQP